MKKFIILFAFFAIALGAMTSCQRKQVVEEVQTVCEESVVIPYQPSVEILTRISPFSMV